MPFLKLLSTSFDENPYPVLLLEQDNIEKSYVSDIPLNF